VDKKSFFLSVPPSNLELLNIDYKNKYYNNKICGEINISPKVTHFIESENLLVTEFIKTKHSSLEIFQSSKQINNLVKNIKILHSGKPFMKSFNMFNRIDSYEKILRKDSVSIFFYKYINNIKRLEPKLFLPNNMLVPCHNDLLPGNLLNKDNQIFIIDFDYSGNNDPCFELGNLSIEMGYNEQQINELVKSYYGKSNERIISRVNLQAIVSDIGWSLWGYVQAENSNLKFDYSTYAKYRMERAINKIESKEFKLWKKNI